MASKNPTTKLKADISEFKSQFQEAQRVIRLANSEFKAATGGMDNWSKSADGLSAKIAQLNKVEEAEKKKLESLQKQYEAVAKEQGANSSGAQELLNKINNQRAAIERCEKNLRNYNEKLEKSRSASQKLTDTIDNQEEELKKLKDKYADVVLEQGKNSSSAKDLKNDIEKLSVKLKNNKEKLDDAKDSADKFDKTLKDSSKSGGGINKYQVALGTLISAGIMKAISGLKNAAKSTYETWQAVDAGQDEMIKKTGATGKEAEKLKKVYNNVAGSVKGDFTDMGNAIGEINTRFGFVDKELEDSAVAFMKYAELNNTDVVSSIQLVSRAMEDAEIEAQKYNYVLDLLTLTGQKTGIGVDKLAENLAKYGAPMRALGFETEESIALFGQWEKAGVNTEIAFSGMKKAIGNWGKEGKDGREEFKKTLDEIGKCPDIASATTKAIEVFGQKAGPDLADAIQGGRFNYEQLLNDLKSSKGTIKNTYDEIEDSGDRLQLTVQKIKTKIGNAVGEFIKKHGPQIEKTLEKIFKKGEKIVKWIAQHKSKVLTTLKTVAGAVAAIWVVEKAKKFYDTIGLVKTALMGLASPTGVAVVAAGAIGAIALAMLDTDKNGKKARDSIRDMGTYAPETKKKMEDLKKEVENVAKKADEVSKGYQSIKTERDKLFQDNEAEFTYYNDLWTELQSIVDENGKIKTGYEDRATWIANELERVTGDEIRLNGGVIDSYEELKNKIGETLIVRQAEAAYNSDESNYQEAIKSKIEARDTLDAAQEALDKAKNNRQWLIDEYYQKTQRQKELEKKQETKGLSHEEQEELTNIINYRWNFDDSTFAHANAEVEKAIKEFQKAQKAYNGYQSVIENHENLGAAVLSGDADAIHTSLVKIQQNYKTAGTATAEELEKQKKHLDTEINELQQKLTDGVGGVTQDMINNVLDLRAKTEMEYKEAIRRAKEFDAEYQGWFELGEVRYLESVIQKSSEALQKIKQQASGLTGADKAVLDGAALGLAIGMQPVYTTYNNYTQNITTPKTLDARTIYMQGANLLMYKKGK